MYELLLGPNQSIRGGGILKRQLMKQQNKLRIKLQDLQQQTSSIEKTSITTTAVSTTIIIPRYVRVNTLVTTTEKVISFLKSKNDNIKIYIDRHIPDLLVLPPTSESREILQELVTSYQVILQDKSSCFSALC